MWDVGCERKGCMPAWWSVNATAYIVRGHRHGHRHEHEHGYRYRYEHELALLLERLLTPEAQAHC